ncbi:hypothetical protein [Listeria fleischmannii]|uniref:Uncharacterized protein n=1 Tax=Listeria fleischmannii TaxID=1069827 RepID=A0A841YEM1_9LIST|nr:hypothetical protein [Listeria fleischmannii]EIA20010.1 hypothetical protein KKC_09267 [Listeria fleischmannii subsp. coloradonensis]MBC1398683.1 hypothetical protein [Listeria fleischmannii]MBC1426973.1 hypothetical protein [Listeria fleischmannii]STY35973.1 Uncharacterised protein [Listeria fleischmannii subsp. coloradonensis]
MYGDTYQRERARAMGDTSGEYTYQAQVLQARLKNKDITVQERAQLIQAELELRRQAQRIELKRAVHKGIEGIHADFENERPAIHRQFEEVPETLQQLQVALKDAFDSVTGEAIQTWLQSTRTDAIRRSQESLYDAW